MDPLSDNRLHVTRREFFGRGACGLGTAALAHLLGREGRAGERETINPASVYFSDVSFRLCLKMSRSFLPPSGDRPRLPTSFSSVTNEP